MKKPKFLNLTPHAITLVRSDCPNKVANEKELEPFVIAKIPPSGKVARVKMSKKQVSAVPILNVPIFKQVPSELDLGININEVEPDTIIIVSILVLQNLSEQLKRTFTFVAPDTNPDSAVRDQQGRILAVKGFITI